MNITPVKGLYLEKVENAVIKDNEEMFLQLEEAPEEMKPYIVDDLVKNNVRMIHFVIKRRYGAKLVEILNGYRMTYDELFAVGIDTLMRAIDKFDVHLGWKFTTLLGKMLHNAFSKFFDRIKIDPNIDSMDATMYGNRQKEDDKDITLLDQLYSSEDVEDAVTNSSLVALVLQEINKIYSDRPHYVGIYKSYISGITHQETLAKMYGCSQVQVSRVIKKVQATARQIREMSLEEVV